MSTKYEIKHRLGDGKYSIYRFMSDPCICDEPDVYLDEECQPYKWVQWRWVQVSVKNSFKAAENYVARKLAKEERADAN